MMKATGIVRRIDDLGRVVIPKEIRRTLRIREGDPLEIYTEKDGEVIFKKYSPVGELRQFAGQICESMAKTTAQTAIVCDRDSVIAAAGEQKRLLLEKSLSAELSQWMTRRNPYCQAEHTGALPVMAEDSKPVLSAAAPILSAGDVLGCVGLIAGADETAGQAESTLVQTIAGFLGRQMES